jgi:hypothetical protein
MKAMAFVQTIFGRLHALEPATLCALILTMSTQSVWAAPRHSSIEPALVSAAASGKRILVFFDAEDAEIAGYYNRLFNTPDFQRVLETRYEFVCLDFKTHSQMAATLSVYRAGTIMIYDSKGAFLGDIKDHLTAADLLHRLKELGGEIVRGSGGPGSVTGPGSRASAAAVALLRNPPPQIPSAPAGVQKGELVLGPVRINANDNKPKKIALLESGKTYVISVEGTISLWRAFPQPGADVLFRYLKGKEPIVPPLKLQSLGLTTGSGDATLYGLISRQTGAEPVYNPTHKYETGIIGEGKYLSAYVRDSSFDDNLGAFFINVYEAR